MATYRLWLQKVVPQLLIELHGEGNVLKGCATLLKFDIFGMSYFASLYV